MSHRQPVPPLQAGWVLVDGLPVFHRTCVDAGPGARAIVHVHGFGISGTYLEPTAALLAARHRTFVPDLPGMGRSTAPDDHLDVRELAAALIAYCDAVGVGQATFVGNSLGCALLVEVATTFPERMERAVLVSPAGGPHNLPPLRAIVQMARDSAREPLSLIPIAVRDYLRFGLLRSRSLFGAMTSYPTIERLANLDVPTLVVIGDRDPLIRRQHVLELAARHRFDLVEVPGAHALNYSSPDVIAALVEAHVTGAPLTARRAPAGVPARSPASGRRRGSWRTRWRRGCAPSSG